MNHQEVINFIEKLWFYANIEEMSLKEYKKMWKKREGAIECILKLAGVH